MDHLFLHLRKYKDIDWEQFNTYDFSYGDIQAGKSCFYMGEVVSEASIVWS